MAKPITTKTTTKRAPYKRPTPDASRVPANAAAEEPRNNPGTGREGSALERAPDADVGQAPPAVEGSAAPTDPEQAKQAEGSDFDPALDGGDDADEIFGDNKGDDEQEPTVDPAAAPVETPAADPAKGPAPEPASDPQPDASAADVETVQFGSVVGTMRSIPLQVVQTAVGKPSTDHAAAMRNAVVSDLMKRMRDTDGRCAPMIFTHSGNPEEPPKLFAGLETMAAAMALGDDRVFVVIIDAADAGRAQAAVAARMMAPKSADDDELMWRVRD